MWSRCRRMKSRWQRILQTCFALRVTVVARGAGNRAFRRRTAFRQWRAAFSCQDDAYPDIDPKARTARLQPAVAQPGNLRGRSAIRALLCAGSFVADRCTIGGNVPRIPWCALPQVRLVHNILNLLAFTSIEGELLELGGDRSRCCRNDLLALMTGSEGMLAGGHRSDGQAAAALHNAPVHALRVRRRDQRPEGGGERHSAGIIPVGLEMMDQAATARSRTFRQRRLCRRCAALLICESDGTDEEVAEEIQRMHR